jgi:hypothetical protein
MSEQLSLPQMRGSSLANQEYQLQGQVDGDEKQIQLLIFTALLPQIGTLCSP